MLTAVFAFLWLVCSSAWARGLQTVKDATSTAGIESTLALCTDREVKCEVTDYASMRSLNISVVRDYTNQSTVFFTIYYHADDQFLKRYIAMQS